MNKIIASPALMQAIEEAFAAADKAVEGGDDIINVYANIAERMLVYVVITIFKTASANDVGQEVLDATIRAFLDRMTADVLVRSRDVIDAIILENETKH